MRHFPLFFCYNTCNRLTCPFPSLLLRCAHVELICVLHRWGSGGQLTCQGESGYCADLSTERDESLELWTMLSSQCLGRTVADLTHRSDRLLFTLILPNTSTSSWTSTRAGGGRSCCRCSCSCSRSSGDQTWIDTGHAGVTRLLVLLENVHGLGHGFIVDVDEVFVRPLLVARV